MVVLEPDAGEEVLEHEQVTPNVSTAGRQLDEASPAGEGEASATPPSRYIDNLDASYEEGEPVKYRPLGDLIGSGGPRGFAPRALVAEEVYVVSSEEPLSFHDAVMNPCWKRAMLEELTAIEENKTWCLDELPPGRRAIGWKWAFKVKRDEHGAVVKHKARLMAKGYAQR